VTSRDRAAGPERLDHGERLPRGRHGIPREEVVAHQRDRMLGAATAELREQGYAGLSVAHITSRAHVSRVTFYRAFDDKLDCVLAAHRAAVAALEQRIRQAYGGHHDWVLGMGASIDALVDFAVESPDQMHLILFVNNSASEPRIAHFGQAVRERLIAAIDATKGKAGTKPMELTEQAALGAAVAVLGEMLETDEPERLPEIKAYLVRLILTPYVGRLKADRIALAA
jgi:AcrR family transcriptional regulator